MIKIIKTEFEKEEFEGSPRFIAYQYDSADNKHYYIFDTEKLDYLPFSHLYYNTHECNMICDILNTVDYLLKERGVDDERETI